MEQQNPEQPGEQEPQTPAQQPTQQPTPPSQQQPSEQPRIPAGYVPVSEVAKERKSLKETNQKLTEVQQKLADYEAKEAKRGILREALKTVGENFTVPDLEDVVDALSFDTANPDNTKAVITKLIDNAKKPLRTGPNTPMFGTAPRDQNNPAAKDGKYALWERMQKRLKTGQA